MAFDFDAWRTLVRQDPGVFEVLRKEIIEEVTRHPKMEAASQIKSPLFECRNSSNLSGGIGLAM